MSSRPIGSSRCHTIHGSRPGRSSGSSTTGWWMVPSSARPAPRSPAPGRPGRTRPRRCAPPVPATAGRRRPRPRSRARRSARRRSCRRARSAAAASPGSSRAAGAAWPASSGRPPAPGCPSTAGSTCGRSWTSSHVPGATGWMPSRQVTPGLDPLGVLDGLDARRGWAGRGRCPARAGPCTRWRRASRSPDQREVERRVADPVARQDQPPARSVPQGQRELAGDPRQPSSPKAAQQLGSERAVAGGLGAGRSRGPAPGQLARGCRSRRRTRAGRRAGPRPRPGARACRATDPRRRPVRRLGAAVRQPRAHRLHLSRLRPAEDAVHCSHDRSVWM